MEVLGMLFIFLVFIVAFAIMIGSIVFIAKDAGKHGQSVALWVVLYIFFGNLALSIYLFVTNRIGWGLFWLFGYPVILGGIFFVLILISGVPTY